MKILAVDDQLDNLELLVQMLEDDYQVKTAKSGTECLDLVQQQKPDLILLDVQMPGMNGYEVMEKLYENEENRDITVILLSARYRDPDRIVKGLEMGAFDYITKPIDDEILLAKVKAVSRIVTSENTVKQYSANLENIVRERTKELRQAEKELMNKEKMAAIGKLSASISHDIRTPLGSLNNSIYFVKALAGSTLDDKIKKHLALMEKEVQKITAIVNDVLDFSMQREPEVKKGQINDLLLQSIQYLTNPAKVAVITNLDATLPMLFFDHIMLQRCFVNLNLNAIQAMPEGGELQISTEQDGESVVIKIKDTGVGIASDDISKIFEPFYTSKPKGIGLGLAIVKDLIDKHNGSIEVESERGKGTTFTVKITSVSALFG